jgi:Flp pilus assembly protein TadD
VLLQASVRAARVRGAPFVAWTDQFIAQCPTVQTAWFMGAMAALGRDGELAVTRARRAVELRAAPDARTALGVALLETGAVVEATATLDEALTSDPRSACAVVRSWVALGGDRPAAAQVWVVRCEKISP